MLHLVLPRGSHEKETLDLFRQAHLEVVCDISGCEAAIEDSRISSVSLLHPQEIPLYVEEGLFDLGIAERDWVEENASQGVSLGELRYFEQASSQPVRLVVAVPQGSPVSTLKDLHEGVKIATPYKELTEKYFAENDIKASVKLSYGVTETKILESADAVVTKAKTDEALQNVGLRSISTILVSYTEFFANKQSYADLEKRQAIEELTTLLQGTLAARSQTMLKVNVADEKILKTIVELLPALKSPTVNPLYGSDGFAIETVVPKSQCTTLIPRIVEAGGTGIVELPITKII